MKFSLVFTLDFRVSDKNVPFTQSLHHKLFTLVYSCLLHASDPDIGLLGLSSLYCNRAKKYLCRCLL